MQREPKQCWLEIETRMLPLLYYVTYIHICILSNYMSKLTTNKL